jgi:20S proteasome subunit beta 4
MHAQPSASDFLTLLLLHLALRCLQSPYHCNLLVAGFDEGVGASLYWLDYLATLHKVNTGGTGYGALLVVIGTS